MKQRDAGEMALQTTGGVKPLRWIVLEEMYLSTFSLKC